MDQYGSLNRAQLSFDYLHTNSTTHEFLFGAIAELIDNSRDAAATELDIYAIKDDSLRGGYMMCFADNGHGMLPDEARSVIIFGRSLKKNADSNSIGMYGNGLKSGSMRIGNDMILFTKKDGIMTCLFLSRSFHEEEKIDEVVVPMPAFKGAEKAPYVENSDDRKKHDLEVSIILQFSPFKCQKDLFSQFDKIKGSSGTLVIIYNMKLLDNGEPELDINTDPRDILLTHPDLLDNAGVDVDVELVDERRSLRAYVSILYADPRMKVYLQGRKVQTKRLISNLANRRMYNFASKTFRTRAETDVLRAKEDVKIAELRAKEAESKARDMETRFGNNLDAEQLRAVRKARNTAMDLREHVKQRQNALVRKQRALKDPKTLTFYFGLNLENRACDGMFVYNCSRLIKMYQRIGPQQDSGMTCRGVVGVVNVPYLVLEPTHNKQDFADAKEFRALMRAMADHLMQYWDDLKIDEKDLYEFWGKFGYLSAKWRDPPSQEEVFARRRAMNVKPCVQCDQCLKWRILPFQQKRLGQEVPDNWQCKDNPDPRHKRCTEPEEQLDIPMGVLKRKIKTKEQRQAELEEQIRKKQSELEQVKKISRDMSADDKEIAKVSSKTIKTQPVEAVTESKKKLTRPRITMDSDSDDSDEVPKKKVSIKNSPKKTLNSVSVASNRRSSTGPSANASKPTSTSVAAAAKQKSQSERKSDSRARKTVSESDDSDEVLPKSSKRGLSAAKAPTTAASMKRPALNGDSAASPNKKPTSSNAAVVDSTTADNVILLDESHCVIQKVVSIPEVKKEPSMYKEKPLLHQAVEVKRQTETMMGEVVEVIDNRVRIRFDLTPTPDNDQWFPHDSDCLLFKGPAVNGSASTNNSPEYLQILENFRNTLRYFLPPTWPTSKESISRLTSQQLADFPMERFFDRYEQGLRQLFSSMQTESTLVKEKLEHCRTLMRRLLAHAGNDGSLMSMDLDVVEEKFEEWLEKEST